MHRVRTDTSSNASGSAPIRATCSKLGSAGCSTTACDAVWEATLRAHMRPAPLHELHGAMSGTNGTRLLDDGGLYSRVFTRTVFPLLDRMNGTTIAAKLEELLQAENI